MTLRRNFLGLMAGVIAVPTDMSANGAAAAPESLSTVSDEERDAELIAACGVFDEADDAVYAPAVADHDLPELMDTWDEALEAVTDLRPKTSTGIQAKALVVMTAFYRKIPVFIGDVVEDRAEIHELAAWSLLHDMLELEEEMEGT